MVVHFEQFLRLQKRYDDFIDKRDGVDATREEWVERLAKALIAEGVELLDATNWKWWKNPTDMDWDNVLEESIDHLHFLLSLWNRLGYSADDVFRAYRTKNEENFARQRGTSKRKGYEQKDLKYKPLMCPKCNTPLIDHQDFQYCG